MEDMLRDKTTNSSQEHISIKRRTTKSHPLYYLLPHLIIFAIFFLVPLIFGIYISFTKWDLVRAPEFVG